MNSERIVDTWDKFRNGEQIGLNRINDLVMSSWRRCREYNIDSETPVYRWVAKSILREGGTISVESEQGKGTDFYIVLDMDMNIICNSLHHAFA